MANKKVSKVNKNETFNVLALGGLCAAIIYLLTGRKSCVEGETREFTCPNGNKITQTCISGVYLPECGSKSAEIISFTIT